MSNNKIAIKTSKNRSSRIFYSILIGGLAGLINGLFGGGGGMIVVPMLVFFLGVSTKKSHATAILIILPLSIVSGIFYIAFGSMDLSVGIPVSIGVTVGGVVGAFLLDKLSSKWIVVIFSLVMVVAGVKMLLF